jgi:hypothetical protein
MTYTGAALEKPVLFLHIPKTAGTSFLLMLQNAFGDNRVRRIKTVDAGTEAVVASIVEHDLDEISCLAGHLPLWLFNGRLDRFAPFTVLREPVARVLSLYHFTMAAGENDLRRLGLRPDSTLAEYLESRHPEIHGQVHNGMVRFLSDDRRLSDFECAEFWNDELATGALERVVDNLQQMDFGLTENLQATLTLGQTRWRSPYEFREYRENMTERREQTDSVADIVKIISMNVLDIALYFRAKEMLAARGPVASGLLNGETWNPRAVFVPTVGRDVAIGDIPGRQGFYEAESDGYAWLNAGRPAQIQMKLSRGSPSLRLKFYCIVSGYPVREIVVRMNGECLRHEFTFVNAHWGNLETTRFDAKDGFNLLEIEAPLFMSPTDVDPNSPDRRKLGIALALVRVDR